MALKGLFASFFQTEGAHTNLLSAPLARNMWTSSKATQKFQKLLSKLSRGETMPKAWASLAPQAPGSDHRELPDCIFAAFRPDAKLR